MDRLERKEFRKRGAATRQLTTDDRDFLIKTPKQTKRVVSSEWVPVSKASGALITEELSLQYSPEIYDYSNNHEYHEEERAFSPAPKKKKSMAKKTQDYTEELMRKHKRDQKRKQKKEQKKIPQKIKIKRHESDYEDDDYDEDGVSDYEDINDEVSDLKGMNRNIKISRLPTSRNRLTSIDMIIHYLRSVEIDDESIGIFKELNQQHFEELLDLNLSNNELINSLKYLKNEKNALRNDLFMIQKEINGHLVELEQHRVKYNQLKKRLTLRKKIQSRLNELKEKKAINDTTTHETSDNELWMKLDRLNKIFDPYWGMIDKLKCINTKLYHLDEQLSK